MTVTETIPAANGAQPTPAKRRKSAGRRRTQPLDERTAQLTQDALECRSFNHVWRRQPIPPDRMLELIQLGYRESVRLCACGCEWIQVYDASTYSVVSSHRSYPSEGYKMPKGTGRLPKNEARRAFFEPSLS